MNYKTLFKGKHIAVIGLGPHGEMTADIKFLLKMGGSVHFYDMRSETRLHGYLEPLREAGLLNMKFGEISADELLLADLIILSPEISRKSLFLKKATLAGKRIEYPDVMFLKIAPPITLIGVMGEYGKSTVAHMLYAILKQSFAELEDQGLFFVESDLSHGALTHLKKIKTGDVVLARISEDMMGEYANARVNPHVAIFTSLASSLEVSTKSFEILKHQTYNNFIVAPDMVIDAIRNSIDFGTKAKMLRTKGGSRALVLQASELFKVPGEMAERVIETFSGLRGHQELVKKVSGIEYYNDSASVTPGATLAALRSFSVDKNCILIFGGAYTGYDYSELIKEIPQHVKTVILLPGSGTLGFRRDIEELTSISYFRAATLEDAVILAHGVAKKGDRVLFSPGCDAVGVHISRKERGEKFVKAVRSL